MMPHHIQALSGSGSGSGLSISIMDIVRCSTARPPTHPPQRAARSASPRHLVNSVTWSTPLTNKS